MGHNGYSLHFYLMRNNRFLRVEARNIFCYYHSKVNTLKYLHCDFKISNSNCQIIILPTSGWRLISNDWSQTFINVPFIHDISQNHNSNFIVSKYHGNVQTNDGIYSRNKFCRNRNFTFEKYTARVRVKYTTKYNK